MESSSHRGKIESQEASWGVTIAVQERDGKGLDEGNESGKARDNF